MVQADRRYTIVHDGRRQLFDHILVSRGLARTQRGADILNDGLIDEGAVDDGNPPPQSLHAPVVAEFELAESP